MESVKSTCAMPISSEDVAKGCSRLLRRKNTHSLPSPAADPPSQFFLDSQLLVMKFGGSSLAGAEHLQRVAGIVMQRRHLQPVLVLSAMGKTTNNLLAAADEAMEKGEVDISKIRGTHEGALEELGIEIPLQVSELLQDLNRVLRGVALLKEISPRTQDLIVSFGERLSVRVFAAVFNHLALRAAQDAGHQIMARPLDSWEVGFVTSTGAGSASSCFSQVEVLASTYSNVASFLEPLQRDFSYMPVVTGYIAKDTSGVITTLGRDGSDLTATVIAASVNASEVQIWKDVNGILTTDPRLVCAARPVSVLTYEEAAEMIGAKVVHPAAVIPAWKAKVPICVRNSMEPEEPGTRIVVELSPQEARGRKVVAMSSKRDVTMMTVRSTRMLGQHGFLARVFQVFEKFEVSIDVIATSEVSVSLTLDQSYKSVDLEQLQKELESVAKVEIKHDLSMLTLITSRLHSGAIIGESCLRLEALGVAVEMISHGASNVNVTFVISDSRLVECTRKLHELFFESNYDPAAAGA